MWILLGLSAAVFFAAFNIYQKHVLTDFSPLTVTLQANLIAAIILSSGFIVVQPFISQTALVIVLASGILNGFSFWCLAEAYDVAEISLVAPLRGASPIIVAAIEPLFLPLSYSVILVGAGIITAFGMYILMYEDSIVKPFKRFKSRGVQLGLLSSFLIAGPVLLDRYAFVVTETHPVTYGVYLALFSMVTVVVLTAVTQSDDLKTVLRPRVKLIPLGVFRAGEMGLALGALSLAAGTRVFVLMQVGPVLAAVIGGRMFRDDNLIRRSIGACLIVLAAIIVVAM